MPSVSRLAISVGAAVVVASATAMGGTASAATAFHTGMHTVCADSLTFHYTDANYNTLGSTTTLHRGAEMIIHKFSSSGGVAYGEIGWSDWGSQEFGWVLNGWYC